MKRVLIHIGVGKTATTLFQKYLFCNHKEINYLGGVRYANYRSEQLILADTYRLFRAILAQDSCEFDTHYWRNFYDNKILKGLSDEKLNLFSEEWLSHTPVLLVNKDRGIVAQRVFDIFGANIKLLMFIRNQGNVLESLFNNHLNMIIPAYCRDSSWALRQIFDRDQYNKMLIQTEDYGILSKYKYYYLVKKYKLLYKNNFMIKLYEDFSENQHLFLSDLAKDLEISFEPFLESYPTQRVKKSNALKVNILKKLKMSISGLIHRKSSTQDVFSGDFIGSENRTSIEIKEYLDKYYAEDNFKLSKLISVNLKGYGYQ
jgi:hypothetical protein